MMRQITSWGAWVWLGLLLLVGSPAVGQDDGAGEGESPNPPAQDQADPRHRTGHYSIDEPGIPYRVIYETRLRYGWEPRDEDTDTYRRSPNQPTNDGDRTSTDWFIEVPEGYRADRPAGVLVMMQSGVLRRCPEQWRQSLSDHNLIWVGFPAGSAYRPWFAHARAIYGLQLVAQRYAVDPRRIYIVGKDNGVTVANAAAVLTPEVFRAAFMLFGGAFPADLDHRGDTYEGFAEDADRGLLREASRRSLLAYFNGEDGIERELALLAAVAYQRAGFGVTVIDEPTHGDDDIPGAEHLAAAVHAFELPLHRDAERAYERGRRMADRGRRGTALPLLLEALSIGSTAAFAEDARAKLTELQDAYAAEVAAIEAHTAGGEFEAAGQALSAFERGWGDHGEADTQRLTEALREARRAARD